MISSSARRLRPRGWGWVCAATAAAFVLDAVRLRQRLNTLAHIDPLPDGATSGRQGRRYRLLSAEGVEVPARSLAAATAYAKADGLDVLELVPDDLDVERLLALVRQVDPATYRGDRLAPGRGAYQAIVIEETTLERAGGPPDQPISEADLVNLLSEAKRCAPVTTDLAVIGGVRAAVERPERRRATIRTIGGGMSGAVIWAPLAGVVGLVAAAAAAPGWGLAALAAYALQPALALGGTRLAKPFPLFRILTTPARMIRTAAAADAPPDPAAAEAMALAREEYRKLLAEPVDRLFEARRSSCPWCDSSALKELLVCADDLQHKPGQFRLDRCGECGHVFQNPRLTLEGLDFYYRDFYDGSGEDSLSLIFELEGSGYRSRAKLVSQHLSEHPARWLDVGSGYAHFCLVAAETFDSTSFEALDMSDAIAAAERRSWVSRSHQGLFPELAGTLTGQFDVVSMFHYLEHSRDPRAELRAARQVLQPGGHLLIEVPDPECARARVLGRWWGPWFQPQHQHLIPLANMCDTLRAEGFEVQAVQRREANIPADVALAGFLLLNHVAPPVDGAWLTPPGRAKRLWRAVALILAAPLLVLALLVDRMAGPLVTRLPHGSNAYRVLARRTQPDHD